MVPAPPARPALDYSRDYYCREIVTEIDEVCEYVWDTYCDQHAERFCGSGGGRGGRGIYYDIW